MSSLIFFDAGEVVDDAPEGGSPGVLEAGDAASWSGVEGGSEDINFVFWCFTRNVHVVLKERFMNNERAIRNWYIWRTICGFLIWRNNSLRVVRARALPNRTLYILI